MTKYETIPSNCYFIFPYENNDGKPRLISNEDMMDKYPCAYEYLSFYRDELQTRSMKMNTEDEWYAYGRSQSLSKFVGGEHLVWPVLSLDSNYVYDDDAIMFSGGGNGPYYGLELKSETRESIHYIQAILNHWLMEGLVKQKASVFRGGYYSHGKQFIAKLPIYCINWNDPNEVAVHDSIVEKVHTIEKLASSKNKAGNSHDRFTFDKALKTVNKQLNDIIDELYGLEDIRTELEDET